MGFVDDSLVLEGFGGECVMWVESCEKSLLPKCLAFPRISSVALAKADTRGTLSDEGPTAGIVDAEVGSLTFNNDPESAGCEDVALFGVPISSDEEGMATAVVKAGVVDLECTGDRY